MTKQNYNNHIRYYPPHHFVFYPVMFVLIGFTAYKLWQDTHQRLIWAILLLLAVIITWLAWMLRQHYALTLQNRLILAELRYRYYILTGSGSSQWKHSWVRGGFLHYVLHRMRSLLRWFKRRWKRICRLMISKNRFRTGKLMTGGFNIKAG